MLKYFEDSYAVDTGEEVAFNSTKFIDSIDSIENIIKTNFRD